MYETFQPGLWASRTRYSLSEGHMAQTSSGWTTEFIVHRHMAAVHTARNLVRRLVSQMHGKVGYIRLEHVSEWVTLVICNFAIVTVSFPWTFFSYKGRNQEYSGYCWGKADKDRWVCIDEINKHWKVLKCKSRNEQLRKDYQMRGVCYKRIVKTEFWSFIPAESAVNEGKEKVQKVYKIVLAM